jgi:hypothetical protein
MKNSTSLRFLFAAGGIALVVLGAVLIAAPFAAVTLTGADHPLSESGANFICLSEILPDGYASVRDVFEDMQAQGVPVQFIQRHARATDLFETYTFGGGSVPPDGWPLLAGEGLVVQVGGADAHQYTIPGGANDPASQILLVGFGPGSASGTNMLCVPSSWDWTASPAGDRPNARQLFQAINHDGIPIQLIAGHRRNDDAFELYTFGGGTLPPNGWDLTPGESIYIKVAAGSLFWWP